MNKAGKGKATLVTASLSVIAISLAVLVIMGGIAWYKGTGGNPLAVGAGGDNDQTITINDGSGVTMTYNDRNAKAAGTDPATNLTIFEKNGEQFDLLVSDDGTSTVDINAEFSGLIGNTRGVPSTTYFAKTVSFSAGSQPFTIGQAADQQIYQAGAPTLSIVNDDGVTKNSDSNDEAMGASSTYQHCLTARAPSQKSSSEYGTAVVFEYDATYISKIEKVSGLSEFSASVFLTHVTNQSSASLDFDQFKVLKFDGELRDGDKDEMCYKITTTSSTPGEDAANYLIHWLPLNHDLDADTLDLLESVLYDEDNNHVYLGNTTIYGYAS